MKDTKDYIEEGLKQLAEKIFNDFNTNSYSAKLYSKTLNNIISSFIEIRLNIFFQKLDIGTNIELKKYDFEAIVKHLYDQLYHEKKINIPNDFKLESILLKLLPSSEDFIFSSKYGNKEHGLESLLQHIESYGIQISRTDLIDYYHIKNSCKLYKKISRKYKNLLSILLTVYLSKMESKNGCSDLPKRIKGAIRFINGTNTIDINNTNYKVESMILKLLQRTINREDGVIKSLYRFPNREQEFQNFKEFIQTNDLWKLDLINPDFILFEKGQRLGHEINTKLNLIRELRTDSSLIVSCNAKMLYFDSTRYLNDDYLSIIKIELQSTFEEWYYHPLITDWENYWFDKKHRLLQNEIIKSYKPKINSIRQIGDSWEVSYSGDRRIVKDLLGIYYFSSCLKSPGTELPYSSINQASLLEGLPRNQEIYDLLKNRRKIWREIKYCKENWSEDPTYYEVQIDKLETELKRFDEEIQNIKFSGSNATLTDRRNSDNFTKACRKAMEHCKKVFPEFYEHIKCYIHWKNGKLTYSGYLDWF